MSASRTAARQSVFALAAVFLALIIVAAVMPANEARAATITVDTNTDEFNSDTDCSLREAIVSANENTSIDDCTDGSAVDTDVIQLPHANYTLSSPGEGENQSETGDLDVTEDVTFVSTASGGQSTISAGGSVDSSQSCFNFGKFPLGIDRVMHIRPPTPPPTDAAPAAEAFGNGQAVHVELNNLVITGGTADEPNTQGGGGILADNAALTLNDVDVKTNTVLGDNESVVQGGGIALTGDSTLNMTGGDVDGNYAAGGDAFGAGIAHVQQLFGPSEENAALGDPIPNIRLSSVNLIENTTCGDVIGLGGALYANTSVSIDESFFELNRVEGRASAFGGAADIGGSDARMFDNGFASTSIDESEFALNEAVSHGEQLLQSPPAAYGGGVASGGTLEAEDSLFDENSSTANDFSGSNPEAQGGGLVHVGGSIDVDRTLLVENTAVSFGQIDAPAASADALGGNVEIAESFGGGAALRDTNATLTNDTFSGNSAWHGGGLNFRTPPSNNQGPSTLGFQNSVARYLTVTDNEAQEGGGVRTSGDPNFGLDLSRSIVAEQEDGDDCQDAADFGTQLNDAGNNLDSDGTCKSVASSQTAANAQLDELDDNGGPTDTHALLAGSPAIDKIDGSGCIPLDQRSQSRPRDGDGNGSERCDRGAFELEFEAPNPQFCPGFANDPRPQIIGTNAPNTLNGTSADEIICGKQANDTITGGGGDDLILGGPGEDKIKGQGGDDRVVAGGGADVVNGNGGNDRLRGFPGNDTLNGDDGEDRITGGVDNDTVNGDEGNDKVFGWDDDDDVNGNAGDDLVFGSLGDDTADGGPGSDRVRGYKGDDKLFGRGGVDTLIGMFGDDILNGGPENDTCYGGPGTNTLIDC